MCAGLRYVLGVSNDFGMYDTNNMEWVWRVTVWQTAGKGLYTLPNLGLILLMMTRQLYITLHCTVAHSAHDTTLPCGTHCTLCKGQDTSLNCCTYSTWHCTALWHILYRTLHCILQNTTHDCSRHLAAMYKKLHYNVGHTDMTLQYSISPTLYMSKVRAIRAMQIIENNWATQRMHHFWDRSLRSVVLHAMQNTSLYNTVHLRIVHPWA